MIDLQKLPVLPDGWRYEDGSAFGKDVVHIVWTDHGAVSIDFEYRSFATGWCLPRPALRGTKIYTGRGWRVDLIDDAVQSLRAAWA